MKALFNHTGEVDNIDDRNIIGLYFARDERAIRETAEKYGRLCHRIAYHILNNQQDAEECVNDTYMGVWNAIPPAEPDSLMSFVCGIARNLSLKRLEFLHRQKRSVEVLLPLDELADVLPDERYAPDADGAEVGRLISRFLRAQKEDVRNVFIRRYYFFDSVAAIAKRYGFTESKVKNMLFHTRNKLKKVLIQEGIEV